MACLDRVGSCQFWVSTDAFPSLFIYTRDHPGTKLVKVVLRHSSSVFIISHATELRLIWNWLGWFHNFSIYCVLKIQHHRIYILGDMHETLELSEDVNFADTVILHNPLLELETSVWGTSNWFSSEISLFNVYQKFTNIWWVLWEIHAKRWSTQNLSLLLTQLP
jgi:hypothetical protein